MLNRFAVMGNPISHSLSPFIHQAFAQQNGQSLLYEKIKVEETHFETQVSQFFAEGGKGLNITLPFKERAFAMAKLSTPRCLQAKAANTLWLSDGQIMADNTDGIGLIRDLSKHVDLAAKKVLLLGAGGAARGIIGPLLRTGLAQLTLANRNRERGEMLHRDFPELTLKTWEKIAGSYDLIINATSASLAQESLSLPAIDYCATTFCYDLAYQRKGLTPFLSWAQAQGYTTVDGLGMLVEQAAEAFYLWHGFKPDTQIVLASLRS